MKRWLRRIVLFPLSILMGVDGDVAATTTTTVAPDAGAVSPESQPAAAKGAVTTTETAGAVSPESQPAAAESGQGDVDTTRQEGDRIATEEARQGHKKPFEERVEELVAQRTADMEARITAQLEQKFQAPEKLDFIPDIDMGKVNAYIGQTLDTIEQMRLDGKFAEALDLQDELNQTRNAVRANESKKAEYMQQQDSRRMSEEQTAQINARIEEASRLVAKEHNIPEEVWKAGEEFFVKERQSKPLVDAQYREMVMLQGPVAALLWAKDYVEKNMGKKEEQLIQQKEAAKEALPAGKMAGGTVPDAAAARLADAKAKAASGNPSDLAEFSRLKRELSAKE